MDIRELLTSQQLLSKYEQSNDTPKNQLMENVKKSRLTFKNASGTQQHLKKKKKTSIASSTRPHAPDFSELDRMPDDGWVIARQLEDLNGPLMILHSSSSNDEDDELLALSAHESKGLIMTRLSQPHEQDHELEQVTVDNAQPDNINQVFHILKLPASAHGTAQTYSIKTVHDMYLTCNKYGQVSADQLAVSQNEEWMPVVAAGEDRFSLISAGSKTYLEYRPDKNELRCDGVEEVDGGTTWIIKCQAQERKRRRRSEIEELHKRHVITLDPTLGEMEQIRRFQSTPGASLLADDRTRRSLADKQELFKAQISGRLNETMLDRRSKLKADRYCK